MNAFTFTNGTNGSTGHAADESIDALYAWMPGLTPPPQPCPEALFSVTLRGKLGGIKTLLTVRGMTSAEFQRNLQSVKGLLDAAPDTTQAMRERAGYCAVHAVAMQANEKDGKRWYSHKNDDGTWCKGRK